MNTFHQPMGFFLNQAIFSSKQKRIFEFLRQEKQDKISLVCIFAHNFEELAKRRGHSEITSFYCWLFSDLAAPRFLSCLCFGIKQTWSNYLRSRSSRRSRDFLQKNNGNICAGADVAPVYGNKRDFLSSQ